MNATLKLLGGFVLVIAGRKIPLPPKAQGLLALLAVGSGAPVSRQTAADMLWTDRAADQARQSLRQCLWALRRQVGYDLVETHQDVLRLSREALNVDVVMFEGLAAAASRDDLAHCADLCRGELLAEIGSIAPRFDEWLGIERERLNSLAATVLRRLAEMQIAAGDVDAGLAAARRLVGLDDLNEGSHRLLIRLLVQAGRRAEALRHYDSCAATLKRELGIAPEPETMRLAQSIRDSAAASQGPARTAAPPETERTVEEVPAAKPLVSATAARGQSGWRWFHGKTAIAGLLFAALLVTTAVYATTLRPPRASRLIVSLFNYPAELTSKEVEFGGLIELLNEELRDKGAIETLAYRSRGHDAVPLQDIAAIDRTARYILVGSASLNRPFRLNIRLSDRNGAELWASRYEVAPEQMLTVVDDAVAHVAGALAKGKTVSHRRLEAPQAPQDIHGLFALAGYVRSSGSMAANAAFRGIVERIIAHNPENATALGLLGNSYLTAYSYDLDPDNLTQAALHLRRALALDPQNLSAMWDQCYLRRMQEDITGALDACRAALDLDPHLAGTLREIGHDLLDLNDPAGAKGWFQAAIDEAPEHPYVADAYLGIAQAELMMGDIDAAVAAARQSLDHEHGGGEAELWLAAVLENQGRHAEARQALAEFYRLHPDMPPSSDVPFRKLTHLSAHPETLAQPLRRLGVVQTIAATGVTP